MWQKYHESATPKPLPHQIRWLRGKSLASNPSFQKPRKIPLSTDRLLPGVSARQMEGESNPTAQMNCCPQIDASPAKSKWLWALGVKRGGSQNGWLSCWLPLASLRMVLLRMVLIHASRYTAGDSTRFELSNRSPRPPQWASYKSKSPDSRDRSAWPQKHFPSGQRTCPLPNGRPPLYSFLKSSCSALLQPEWNEPQVKSLHVQARLLWMHPQRGTTTD